MNVIDRLASSLNRRDDVPNQEFAEEIIKTKNKAAVKGLIAILGNKDTNIQSDCIKVLYETGECGSPELIADYCKEFGKLLKSKNNRLVWGAMTALDTITFKNPKGVFSLLPDIICAIKNGSVITIDHGVSVLAKLSSIKEYSTRTFSLLMEQLRKCPPRQFPMYTEKSVITVTDKNKKEFVTLLKSRLPELKKDSQRKRIEKILKKII